MRSLIIGFVVFLTACNGSTTTNVPYSDPALVAKVNALTEALAAATHESAQKFASIQLNGPEGAIHGTNKTLAISNGIDFGPCSGSGTKVGQSGSVGLDDETQVFKQTPTQTCPGVYSEYDVGTGSLHTIHRIYYTSNDCTGDAYVWDGGGLGIDQQKTTAGVSFISPNPTDNGQMWVAPGTQSQIIQAGSAFIIEGGGCEFDGDLQPMWLAVHTDTQTSGVALSLGAGYQVNGL